MSATRDFASFRVWLSAMGAATLLTACGGGSRVEAISVAAQDERATMAWRSSARFDVLANDSASRGGVVLEAVAAPANGSAVIDDGQIRYTPADGWFGTDAVRYTVRAADGAVTAEATLRVDVQARLALSGVITDAPVADAAVTVRVGDETLETEADAEGRYTVEVVSSAADALVQVEGVSPDGRVRLLSLVGALQAVADAADAEDGRVDSAALPALDATHWSTASAALVARANGGVMPADVAALAAVSAAIPGNELLRLATAVRLVADQGVELPEGVTDTLALVREAEVVQAFIDQNATVFAQARAGVLAEAPRVGVPPELDGPLTLAVTLSSPLASGPVIVTLRADGTALLTTQPAARGRTGEASWEWEDGRLLVVYAPGAAPESESFPFANVPGAGPSGQIRVIDRTLGVALQLVTGSWTQGAVTLEFFGERRYGEGPLDGELTPDQPFGGTGSVLYDLIDTAQAQGFAESDVAVGTRLAGIQARTPPARVGLATVVQSDILRIDGPGMGTLEATGLPATWTLEDGWLRVEVEGALPLRYKRLARNPALGFENWWVEGEADGADAVRMATVGARIAEDTAFTPEQAQRHWRFEWNQYIAPSLTPGTARLFADGSMSGFNAVQWRIDEAGVLVMTRFFQGQPFERRWTLVEVLGRSVLVLETIDFSFSQPGLIEQRLSWYYDLGPGEE